MSKTHPSASKFDTHGSPQVEIIIRAFYVLCRISEAGTAKSIFPREKTSFGALKGCLDGFEPSTSASTVQRSAVELQAPYRKLILSHQPTDGKNFSTSLTRSSRAATTCSRDLRFFTAACPALTSSGPRITATGISSLSANLNCLPILSASG